MQKKLYRSPKDGIILGIASGLGHYFDKDPVLIRIIIVVLAFITKGWPVIVLYGVLFLIIPVDPAQASVSSNQEPKDVTPDEPKAESEENKEGEEKEQKEPEEITEDAPEEKMDSSQNM